MRASSRSEWNEGHLARWQVLAVLVALTAACSSPPASPTTAPTVASGNSQPAAAPSGAPIKLGVLADISPAFANQGAMMRIMTDYAVQTINAQGGINGRPLQASYADPKGDPSQAVQLATQFIQQDNVDALVGAVSSAECLGVEDLASKAASCTSPALAAQPTPSPPRCATSTPSVPDRRVCKRQTPSPRTLSSSMAPTGRSSTRTTPSASHTRSRWRRRWRVPGGALKVKIAMPLSEPNVTPYVSQIPSDGSIPGFLPPTGGTDVSRVMSVFTQFGMQNKMVVAGASVREFWRRMAGGAQRRGVQPGAPVGGDSGQRAFGSVGQRGHRGGQPGGREALCRHYGRRRQIRPRRAGLSGLDRDQLLKLGMQRANYQGKADTDKLIAAMESVDEQPSADFPAGRFIMNKDDHQGKAQQFILKLNGQTEQIVQTINAEDAPPIGTCKITG